MAAPASTRAAEKSAAVPGRCEGQLFDGVSERACVVADPNVARHDRHELGRFAKQLCGRKMHRIKRANRFHGKGPADTREHGVGDGDDVATTFEYSQPSDRSALLGGTQTSADAGADDRPCSFHERQRGRHVPSFRAQRLQGRRVAFQQCGKEGA